MFIKIQAFSHKVEAQFYCSMGHDGTTSRPFEGLRSAGGVEGPSGFGLPDVTDTPAGQAVEPTDGVLD